MSESTTIAVTTEGNSTLSKLVNSKYFKEQQDAAKFAAAYAIKLGVEPSAVKGGTTKWNIGSFDSDGKFRELIKLSIPDQDKDSIKIAEGLIQEGLILLNRKLEDAGGIFSLEDIIA